jgi:glycine/D-amino acid oxidase-like deaminating enzyme
MDSPSRLKESMRIRSDETYWLLKNGLLTVYPSLQKNTTCDVLVVGGGITGALIAYQCSLDGLKTIVVDKRDIALGSTSASTSMLQYEIDEPLYSLKKKIGANIAIDCYQEGVKAIDKLEALVQKLKLNCGFERKDSLYLMRSSKDEKWFAQEFEARQEAGLPVKMLSKAFIQNKYKATAEAGIVSTSGASFDAYAFTHQLFKICADKFDVKIYDHTLLNDVEYCEQGKKHIAKMAGDFNISFKSIVYASGYESQSQLPQKVASLISTYAFVSEPISGLPKYLRDTLFWDTQDPYLYVRSTEDNRMLVGGADVNFKNPLRRDLLIEKKERLLMKQFSELFPDLKIIPDFSWAGTFGVTKDALPYIGPYHKKPDTYYALGFGGNGITFSVMGMQIISDALAGRPNRFIEYFRFGR